MTSNEQETWWTNAVGYEVYIRSFADGDGDGVGDLQGLHDRLDHLAWLGIDIVWITPFYRSPMADFGYDVADYVDVEPTFGDLAALDRVVERCHELDMRCVVDIVPNHSSAEHAWFRDARRSRDATKRDYYIWRDPAPDGGPPNNWVSYFGGPAWTLDETTGQYYLHLFLPEQPDLNWRNPDVRREFEDILRFWFDRGVDGLRIDVAQAFVKDDQFRDNPPLAPLDSVVEVRERFVKCFRHDHDILQPESHEIFRAWRAIADSYDNVLIGETYELDPERLATLVPGDGLHLGFWFAPMSMSWEPGEIRSTLSAPGALGGRISWVQGSHDESRPVSRFGGGAAGRARSLALSTMFMGLPGLPFLYQGEELGLADGDVPPHLRADPVAVRNEGNVGRDVCRTPMPWDLGPQLGFSTNPDTWLPLGHEASESVAAQRAEPDSYLHRMRDLIALRRSLPELAHADVDWLDTPAEIVAFERAGVVFALNASESDLSWAPGGSWNLLYQTDRRDLDERPVTELWLPADVAVVARRND